MFYKFIQQDFGDPFKADKVDPDSMIFAHPDFGFNNTLTFGEETGNGWRNLQRNVGVLPLFERLSNYITFIKDQKTDKDLEEEVKRQFKGIARQPSVISKWD